MDLERIQQQLIAAARLAPPSDHVPYAFEKRIMARLGSASAGTDVWAVWSRLLWRAAGPCVGIMLLMSAWTAYSAGNSNANLAAEFERTVWGPFTSLNETW
jgi:hypothetical protein